MKANPVRLLVATLAVAAFLALTPRASAEVVTLQLTGTTPELVGVKLGTATDNIHPGPYFWKQAPTDPMNNNFPPPIATFCMELSDVVQVGGEYTFAVLPLENPATTVGSVAKAEDIKALYGNFYNPNWAAVGFTGDDFSKAFQLALWELIYETDPVKSVTNGHFQSPSSVAGLADTMLNGLAGGLNAYNNSGYEIVALVAPVPDALKPTPGQDQIAVRPKPDQIPGVPAPPAALLAGLGVLALAGRARWTRRPTAAA